MPLPFPATSQVAFIGVKLPFPQYATASGQRQGENHSPAHPYADEIAQFIFMRLQNGLQTSVNPRWVTFTPAKGQRISSMSSDR